MPCITYFPINSFLSSFSLHTRQLSNFRKFISRWHCTLYGKRSRSKLKLVDPLNHRMFLFLLILFPSARTKFQPRGKWNASFATTINWKLTPFPSWDCLNPPQRSDCEPRPLRRQNSKVRFWVSRAQFALPDNRDTMF